MSWYWKQKLTWRKGLITYNSHPWVRFSFNWLVIIWRRRGGGRGFVWNWTSKVKGVEEFWTYMGKGGGGSWKLRTISMNVICVSSLVSFYLLFDLNMHKTYILFLRKHLPFVFWRQTNFAKFIGNHLFQSLVFIKVAWKRDFGTAGFLWILRNF